MGFWGRGLVRINRAVLRDLLKTVVLFPPTIYFSADSACEITWEINVHSTTFASKMQCSGSLANTRWHSWLLWNFWHSTKGKAQSDNLDSHLRACMCSQGRKRWHINKLVATDKTISPWCQVLFPMMLFNIGITGKRFHLLINKNKFTYLQKIGFFLSQQNVTYVAT